MGEILRFEDASAHLVVEDVKKNMHVIPKTLMDRVAAGTVPITDIEEYELFLPTIIKEWLDGLDA